MGKTRMGYTTLTAHFVSDPALIATSDSAAPHDAQHSYDYVIVGGGTAGCVLASRLSEDPKVSVLLIEAGGSYDNTFFQKMPMAFATLLKTRCDWNYETAPQKELNNRRVYWPRGKILGGSSSINAAIYHQCDPADLDSWEKAGATGWSYDSMKKYFLKAEKYNAATQLASDSSARGRNGPWNTNRVLQAPISDQIISACEKLGIRRLEDLNTSEGTRGAGSWLACVDKKHERSSTANAYLTKDVLKRPNLTIVINTMTEKIIFSNEGEVPLVRGVQISRKKSGPKYLVKVKQEVILSAGVVASPQLLLLSGIGPAQQLDRFDIPVVCDLPAVGKNLKDHFSIGPVIFPAKAKSTWDYVLKPWGKINALLQWLLFRKGPMGSLACQVAVFVRSDDESLPFGDGKATPSSIDTTSGPNAPDVEIPTFPFIVASDNFGYKRKVPAGACGLTMGPVLLRPASTGTIELASSSVWDYPVVDPNYLDEEHDMNVAIKAFKLMIRLTRTEPLASGLKLTNSVSKKTELFWPGDANPDTLSDDDIRLLIRENGQTTFHPTSSAKMGASSKDSVVDSDLRVYGVAGLRVVDASVFPDNVSGHPVAVVVAVAERAADLIKASTA